MLALLGCAVSHVSSRSPIRTYKKSGSLMEDLEKSMFSARSSAASTGCLNGGADTKPSSQDQQSAAANNKVMVVVNHSPEAEHALQWALTHTIQTHDVVVLLHVTRPCKQGGNSNSEHNNVRAGHDVLCKMESICQAMRPGVRVNCVLQQGKEKGSVIVEAAKQQGVSLLVLGQKRRSKLWRLRMAWSTRRAQSKLINHCIHNAACMTIAVRRKNRKHGGYLITTKSHKNFWLLA
ncbi:unnamed protein product [Cuscuta campestris]|uniref:UspA domain-containing protein n=1 Tax=Cuscuta campestris TaxID=132261 RepID=A0A484LKE5_9ASTE|nr:unnamed protein product [Cuscuta campestris]